MNKKICAIVTVLSLIIMIPSMVFAMKLDRGKRMFIDGYEHSKLDVYGDNKMPVTFEYDDRNNTLVLRNKNSYNAILVFKPFTPNIENPKYNVCKVTGKNPNKVFFEVDAEDENGYNIGFWVIGLYKGKWVTYVSTDNLMKMGYNPNGAHIFYPTDTDGNYAINIYRYASDIPYKDDWGGWVKGQRPEMSVKLFWDNNNQWFGMKKNLYTEHKKNLWEKLMSDPE